ncbi:MAG: carboxypeptidase regulatory-like domain-containing protein [Acidobacteria bacterium]|nr:carboxypeptidase regulatory-like domain-containing protein [Acidobacteriota bacterium]
MKTCHIASFFAFALFLCGHSALAQTWNGNGPTNNWSDPFNWSTNAVPANGAAITFNGTGVKDCVIDIDIVTGSFTIDAGYTGTISQGASNLTHNGTFTQNGGTFHGGSGSITFVSSFNLTGGTFAGSTGTTSFNYFFTQSGTGTFVGNGGTAVFNGSAANYSAAQPQAFNNVTINKNNLAPLSLIGSSVLAVNGLLTLQDGRVDSNGTLEARGGINVSTDFDGGNGKLRFAGSGVQSFINEGGIIPTGIFTVDKSGGTVQLLSDLNLSNGTQAFDLVNGTITTGAFIVNAGTRSVNRTTGYINGNLRRVINSIGPMTFDVGTENGYSPLGMTISAFVNPSALTIAAVQSQHPNRPLTGSSMGRYWSITEEGNVTAVLTFHYLDADLSGIEESSFQLFRYTGAGTEFTQMPATHITTANTMTTIGGITEFSDWTMLSQLGPTSATASVSGRVLTAGGRAISMADLRLTDTDGRIRRVITNPFGYFKFNDVTVGGSYILSVAHKTYIFAEPYRVITVKDEITGIDFIALDPRTTGSLGMIEGSVTDEGGNPVEGIEIEMIGGDETSIVVLTGKRGEFTFNELLIGRTYILIARSEDGFFVEPVKTVALEDVSASVGFQIHGKGHERTSRPRQEIGN